MRKDKEKKINKKSISEKKQNPVTIAVDKVKIKKTSGSGENKYSKKQFKKDAEGACIICGAVGDIVKKISWNWGNPQHFSFRVKRTMINDNNGKKDKKEFPMWFRHYWRK